MVSDIPVLPSILKCVIEILWSFASLNIKINFPELERSNYKQRWIIKKQKNLTWTSKILSGPRNKVCSRSRPHSFNILCALGLDVILGFLSFRRAAVVVKSVMSWKRTLFAQSVEYYWLHCMLWLNLWWHTRNLNPP